MLQANSAPVDLVQTYNRESDLLPHNTDSSATSLAWYLEKSLTESPAVVSAATAGADGAAQEACTAQQVGSLAYLANRKDTLHSRLELPP